MQKSFAPLLLAMLFTAGCGNWSVQRITGSATGFTSHELCSAVFISGLDAEQSYREGVAPLLSIARPFIGYEVDLEHKQVHASFAGMNHTTAVYHEGYGCRIEHGRQQALAVLPQNQGKPLLPDIAGPAIVETSDPALQAALVRHFDELPDGPPRHTKAVVIVHRGRIIAERYAPGIGVDTPLHGWSATKSITNALIGILVQQGKLRVDQPAAIAAWQGKVDPRHGVTLDQLLRMTSGLDLGQSLEPGLHDAVDLSSQMLWDEDDMAAYGAAAPLATAPGTQWTYADASTVLASSIVRDASGGTAASAISFARRELFDQLGMQHAVLEVDGSGSPLGATHMFASARDWARFGMLYLNDGVIGGVRILPPGWVDYSARATPQARQFGYGAGFWTNRDDGPGAASRIAGGMPADAFMARGAMGQYVIIVPSQQLVVVRLGWSQTRAGDIDAVDRLVADVVQAIRK